jgi:hypothetical protein
VFDCAAVKDLGMQKAKKIDFAACKMELLKKAGFIEPRLFA